MFLVAQIDVLDYKFKQLITLFLKIFTLGFPLFAFAITSTVLCKIAFETILKAFKCLPMIAYTGTVLGYSCPIHVSNRSCIY